MFEDKNFNCHNQIRCIALRVCKLRMGFSVPSIIWVGAELMQITMQRNLVPRRFFLIHCPREVWERAGERTRSRRVSLGDVTAHGRLQKWPSRKRLGTRLDATISPSLANKNKTENDSRLLKILSLERLTTLTFFYNMIFIAKFVVSRCAFWKLGFSVPSIIVADLLGNTSLLVIGAFRSTLLLVSVFQGSLLVTALHREIIDWVFFEDFSDLSYSCLLQE